MAIIRALEPVVSPAQEHGRLEEAEGEELGCRGLRQPIVAAPPVVPSHACEFGEQSLDAFQLRPHAPVLEHHAPEGFRPTKPDSSGDFGQRSGTVRSNDGLREVHVVGPQRFGKLQEVVGWPSPRPGGDRLGAREGQIGDANRERVTGEPGPARSEAIVRVVDVNGPRQARRS